MIRTLLAAAMLFAAAHELPAAAEGSPPIDWFATGTTGAQTGKSAIDLDQRATRRIAVVVGNDDYRNAPDLENARGDAQAMTAFLRDQGFQVEERFNLDKRGFEDLMRRILYEVGPDAEVLFYFAGHGIQIGRRNYLLPVDADLSSVYDAPFETVTLDSLVKILGARSRLQLVILNSCRDNPFADAKIMTEIDRTLFETRDGFNAMSAPVNSLVAYATSPGAVAFDGNADGSPFTGSLIRLASADPAVDVRELLDRVRRDVYERTEGRQVPWESSTLVERFVLGPEQRPGPGRAQFGKARGLATIVAQLSPGTAADPAENAPVRIAAPLDRRIALGEALIDALDLPASAQVTLGTALDSGRLVIEGETVSDYRGQPLGAGDLPALVYEFVPRQRPALGGIDDFVMTERIAVTADGSERIVELTLEPDACDIQAGDWLDPEGVGLARYPNEIRPEDAVPACRAAIERSPETGRFHHQIGRALQADLRYDEARAAFETARDLGHTRAWHALGDLVADAASIAGGQSSGPAPQEALDFYAMGVEKGDPYAYHALGKQLLRHGRTEAARSEGFELLGQAIELGHTFAMNELGYYFMRGDSVHFEPQRGLRYLNESAARNDIYGYNNLGLVYDNGLGEIAPDPAQALAWYTKAAEGGHPYAPVNIGRMYFNGKLGAPDMAEAVRWYDEGLARGMAWGGANAAWVIANQRPDGFILADAAVRAAKAAALRDEEAAGAARALLDALDRRTLDAAAQMMIREHDPAQIVDGVAGPQTRGAIDALAASHGLQPPPDNAVERLLLLARIHWRTTGIRIDLL